MTKKQMIQYPVFVVTCIATLWAISEVVDFVANLIGWGQA